MPAEPYEPCTLHRCASCFRTPAVAFAFLVLVHLVPVWAFRYIPTQDGPSHLSNALILKDLGSAQTRYHEFFELRREPFPNWTSHVLLAGLLSLFPPLLAERVLVSGYVIGFAWSFRYFLGALGGRDLPLAPAGFLFLFNYCFWMGFYNYIFSFIVFWIVLGYCLRRRQTFDLERAAVLGLLFTLAYFTHLVGYVLCVASALWLLANAPPKRPRKLLWLAASVLPSGLLASNYLLQAGFFDSRQAPDMVATGLSCFGKPGGWDKIGADLARAQQAFFAPYDGGELPLAELVVLFFAALACATWLAPPAPAGAETDSTFPRLPLVLLGLLLGLLYFLLPDSLGAHGSLLKPRLVLLCPLLWLGCMRLPELPALRLCLLAGLHLLLAVNLVLVVRHFHQANREIAEFTAGILRAGENRSVWVVLPRATSGWNVHCLEHAGDYYCLTTRNVNLDNYEATEKYFPVRFRPGLEGLRRDGLADPRRSRADVILVWDSPTGGPWLTRAGGYQEVYHRGRLKLFAKLNDGETEGAPVR